jgi:transcriptional regulator with XRE-family HTH domain
MNTQKIRDLCHEKNLSLADLARQLGMTPNGLQSILREKSTNTSTLERIAEILKVSPSIFFTDEPIGSSQSDALKQCEEKVELLRSALRHAESEITLLREQPPHRRAVGQ